MPSLVVVRNLSVEYSHDRTETTVVSDISFSVAEGEAIGVLGESGCGKTTTALAIMGLLPSNGRATSGSIQFRGRELLGLADHELQKIRGHDISLIFQEPASALNPVMRVGDQIAEVVRAHLPGNSRTYRETAEAIVREVQLPEQVYSAYPHQLSGGQRQRIGIAQAICCRPSLIIADEPTASLDTTTQAEILELLERLKQKLNIAFLFISHNPALLQKFADRVLVMNAGKIVEQGDTAQVLRNPVHAYTQTLMAVAALGPYGHHKHGNQRLGSIDLI